VSKLAELLDDDLLEDDLDFNFGQGLGTPEWHLRAACGNVDPEIFFPERGGSTPADLLDYVLCSVGTTPSCCMKSIWSMHSQCSMILPSLRRRMSTY
jgi:hypothetical protein